MHPRLTALLADLAAVLVFVLIGRRTHDEGSALAGTVATAWPFVTGAVAGELAALRLAPRAPLTGAVVAGGAVVVGMPLRWLAGGGTPVSFVVVAATVLVVLLVGWRLAARVLERRGVAA